jgi:hypothetical protein
MRTTSISAVAVAKLICWRPFARRSSRTPAQGTVSTIADHIALAARRDALTRKHSRAYPLRDHLFSALSRATAVVTPAMVVYVIAASGWRAMFYILGALGTAWAFAWYASYRSTPAEYPKGGTELALLPALPIPAQSGCKRDVPSRRILGNRDLRRLSTVYFYYGLVIWLYLAWLPTYSKEARHFAGLKPDLASLPVLEATATSIAGGLLSGWFASQWGNLRPIRIIAADALLPGVPASQPLAALDCLTVAPAGLELTVAVSRAICIDIGGEFSGSVSSVTNAWGNLGAAISAVAVGHLAKISDGHRRLCWPAGCACRRFGW